MKLKMILTHSLCCTWVMGLGLITTALEVSALPIDGSVYFGVSATLNDTNLLNTSEIVFDDAFTIGASGLFAGVPSLTQVSMSSLMLDPFEQVTPLWSMNAGGQDYWFNLTSLSVVNRTSDMLSISGTGLLISNTEQLAAKWSLGLTSRGQGVSVTYLEPKSVPDGGNTALLCLLAFACLVPFRLKQKQAGFKLTA